MMEYSASAEVKQAMERAHAERSQVLLAGLGRLFRLPRFAWIFTGISRWA